MWQAGYFNDVDRDFHATFDRHLDELLPAFATGASRRCPPPPAGARCDLAHAIIDSFETGVRVAHPASS